MKSLGIFLLLTSLLSAFEYDLKPVKVNERVYCFFGKPEVMDTKNNGNMVNSCFVDTGSSWLVIDSGPTYKYAKEAYSYIKKIKNTPVSHVINTHIHDDHWLGNGFYLSLGANILGSFEFKNLVDVVQTPRMAHRISPKAYSLTVPTIPAYLIHGDEMLNIGSMQVQIIYVDYKAHTQSDLFVYIPQIKTLFGGDLIFNDRLPSLRDGNIKGWIKVLDKIKKMDVKTIVGGHGELTDISALDLTYGYLTQLRQKVQDALDNGVEIDEAVEKIKMKNYENIAFYDVMHRQNVEATYRMLEWEDE